MKRFVLGTSALALISSLPACGRNQPAENNMVTEDLNATVNLPPAEPAAKVIAEEAVTEAGRPEPAAPSPAPARPAPAKSKQPPAPEPEDPHAGHDMNNMQ